MSQAKHDAAQAVAIDKAMAQCMEMFRSDMIRAGVIDESVSPMFMTEAILGAIQRAVLAEREACARLCLKKTVGQDGSGNKYRVPKHYSPQLCADAIRARGVA